MIMCKEINIFSMVDADFASQILKKKKILKKHNL